MRLHDQCTAAKTTALSSPPSPVLRSPLAQPGPPFTPARLHDRTHLLESSRPTDYRLLQPLMLGSNATPCFQAKHTTAHTSSRPAHSDSTGTSTAPTCVTPARSNNSTAHLMFDVHHHQSHALPCSSTQGPPLTVSPPLFSLGGLGAKLLERLPPDFLRPLAHLSVSLALRRHATTRHT